MILLSWPFGDPDSGEPLELHAELESPPGSRNQVITVDVRRGGRKLTGKAIGNGHECRFQLGFWELMEPMPPSSAIDKVKRMNVIPEIVASRILQDLKSHRMGYSIPSEKLVSVLSKERMKDLSVVIEVMVS